MKISMSFQQAGVTLIELMIALTIGLMISAIAVQLFVTSQTNWAIQQAMHDMQESGNFGLEYIAKDIRKANLGALSAVADGGMMYGGIVLTQANLSKYVATSTTTSNNPTPFNVSLMSRSDGLAVGSGSAWTGISNVVSTPSDQLTIQYKAVQTLYSDEIFAEKKKSGFSAAERSAEVGYDCQGVTITVDDVIKNTYIVQRYFLRKDNNALSTEPNAGLALACAAGRYTLDGIEAAKTAEATSPTHAYIPQVIQGSLAGSGDIVLSRVDHFHVLLGISEGTYTAPTRMRYVSIKQYLDLINGVALNAQPQIRSVQLGLLIRATNSSGSDVQVSDNSKFTLLDQQDLILKNSSSPDRYMRQVVTQSIALRNALGEDDR